MLDVNLLLEGLTFTNKGRRSGRLNGRYMDTYLNKRRRIYIAKRINLTFRVYTTHYVAANKLVPLTYIQATNSPNSK